MNLGSASRSVQRLIIGSSLIPCFFAAAACDDGVPAANAAPSVQIISPTEGTSTLEGVPLAFLGSAVDPEDGNLVGGSLVWTSNLQGIIGSGRSFETASLLVGSQDIKLTATDRDGLSAAAGVSIAVLVDSTPASIAGRIVRANDDTGFADVALYLIGDPDTVVARSGTSGEFVFSNIIRGDYLIKVRREDLPRFGAFSASDSLLISVAPGQSMRDLRIEFRVAEVVVRTVSTPSTTARGSTALVTVELALSDIPLPLGGIAGRVAWDDSRAMLVDGSPAGESWTGGFLVNDEVPGEIRFAGIAIPGIVDHNVASMTFRVTAIASGTVEFDPSLTELEVVDTQTGESVPVLETALVKVAKGAVTIQ